MLVVVLLFFVYFFCALCVYVKGNTFLLTHQANTSLFLAGKVKDKTNNTHNIDCGDSQNTTELLHYISHTYLIRYGFCFWR